MTLPTNFPKNLTGSLKVKYNALFVLFVSFSFLLIATKSSPLYPINDWGDANAIFTVGKAMANGKVPYKDIFEQKGPLLYAIHAAASVISVKTFIGVFIMEVIAFSIFLFYCGRIFELFLKPHYIRPAIIISAFLILCHTTFVNGDSAEEYCLPLLTISLFYLLKHYQNGPDAAIPNHIIILHGLMAGCVIWIKYSMIGFWFGLVLSYGILLLISKRYAQILRFGILFLLGILISTIPWFLYFVSQNGLKEFVDVYFVTNIKYYPSTRNPFINLVIAGGKIILLYFRTNIISSVVMTVGLASLFFTRQFYSHRWLKVGILLPFLFLFISVYAGGKSFVYYFQIFLPVVVFGVIFILRKLSKGWTPNLRYIKLASYSGFILLWFLMYFFHHNSYFLDYKKEDLVHYKFATYINNTEDPTLLNYGFLDMGLYHTARIEPVTYYFEKQNFDYEIFPQNIDSLDYYVSNKVTDFVVVRRYKDVHFKNSHILDNYREVMSQDQIREGEVFTYMLFQRKD